VTRRRSAGSAIPGQSSTGTRTAAGLLG
jgi:hypothetical protein